MENLILLMLFTYPGAISYTVYYLSTKDKTYYQELDSFSRTAWCFFLSAAITIMSFGILSLSTTESSLITLIAKIKTTNMLWKYLLLSFALSLIVGVSWHLLRRLYFHVVNHIRSKHDLSPFGKEQKVWQNLINNYDITDCVAVIKKGGKTVRAGMPQLLPDDLGSDKVIVLSHCEEVEGELNKPNHGLLGKPFVSAYDLSTDIEIEFIASHLLDEKIYGKGTKNT